LKEIVKDGSGNISHINVEILPSVEKKLKGFIHWVSEEHSLRAEVRLFNHLFTVEAPDENWLS